MGDRVGGRRGRACHFPRVLESARTSTMHALDLQRDVKLHRLVRPGSGELVDLYRRAPARGHGWPTTRRSARAMHRFKLERTVLAVGRELRRLAADPRSPEVGEDIKVMGAAGRLDPPDRRDGAYRPPPGRSPALPSRGEVLARSLKEVAASAAGTRVELDVNAADDPEHGQVYVTVTGTSAEAGDDGQVGRGNRVNGLITPCRPMTLEAAAGKNPVSHVGKLYNLTAFAIADAVVASVPEVAEAECLLVSRIGQPVKSPALAEVRVRCRGTVEPADVAAPIRAVVERELGRMDGLADRLIAGTLAVC
ncbi:MAG: methionine adenosyltransferase [Byssovorax sp.]